MQYPLLKHALIRMEISGKYQMFVYNNRKFSKIPGYIKKIPLTPPLQKGEVVGMPELPELIEKLLIIDRLTPDS